MKSAFFYVAMFLSIFSAFESMDANATCPSNEDVMSCSVTFKNEVGIIDRKSVNFSVFSSTYFCDGSPNRHFSQDFVLNADFTAVIFADWYSVRFSFYNNSDTNRNSPIGDFHSARAPGDKTESTQSAFVSLGERGYGQIMCSTVYRGT